MLVLKATAHFRLMFLHLAIRGRDMSKFSDFRICDRCTVRRYLHYSEHSV